MDLFEMKGFLDNLVDTFAMVLDLECTIINANPIKRVSGTGIYKQNPDDERWHNSYAFKVIEDKKPLVVIDTTSRPLAKLKDCTDYYSVVLHPIMVKAIFDNNNELYSSIIVLNDFKEIQGLITQNDHEINSYALNNIIANNDSNILLFGESGTGKELFARAIHATSYRRDNPFIIVNCAAIPDRIYGKF